MKFLLDQDVYAGTARTLAELARVLQAYSEQELKKAFVVVKRDGHRFRRLPAR